jgi:uncharacterized protein (TIGR03435 family)
MIRYLATLICLSAAIAQTGSDPTFEAASIKPFPIGTPVQMSGCQGGPGGGDPGRIDCQYVTLKMLIMRAYKVKAQEVFGPAWIDLDHFNINAKVPAGATSAQVPGMFRSFLAERFKLEAHTETRPISAWVVTVAKGGLKIKEASQAPAPDDNSQPGGKLPIGEDGFPVLRPASYRGGLITLFRNGRARMQGSGVTLSQLAESLSGQLDRIVADETELTGKFDILLNWTPERTEIGARPEASSTTDPGMPPEIFAAIEQQLGLKLVSKKIDRNVILVDRAEKAPTEN